MELFPYPSLLATAPSGLLSISHRHHKKLITREHQRKQLIRLRILRQL
jgi:hypothetical protein